MLNLDIGALCKKNDDESGANESYFEEAIEESKMTTWEQETGIKIPESYKDWLRFTRKCRIIRNTAKFWGPDEFHSNYVPEEYVVIGEMVGDGELVCFSKETGCFANIFEGEIKQVDSFNKVLTDIIKVKNDKPILSHDRYLEILAKIEAEKEGN